MRKITVLALMVLSLLIPAAGFSDNTDYKSTRFSAVVSGNGMVNDLKVGKQIIIRRMHLTGSYIPGEGVEKHDTRLPQYMDFTPCTISRPDADTMVVEKKAAVLGNKKYAKAAIYTEKITFTPDKVTAEYEVETTEPMASQLHLFMALCELPLDFAGLGYKSEAADGQETMGIIPKVYKAEDKFRIFSKKIAFAIPGGVVTVEGEPGLGMAFYDGRAWKGDHLQLDIYQQMPWQNTPVTFPAGTKFKWAFSISYAPVQE